MSMPKWIATTLEQPHAPFHAGTYEDAIEMNFVDWHRITQPREGDFVGAVH